MTYLTIQSSDDADRLIAKVREGADLARRSLIDQSGDPLDLLRRIKFEPIGAHPIEHRCLNFIEQVNQTWTFVVAIAAARQLLELHRDAGGFRLAPGAHACQALDIMSECKGLVGAETFAAVSPHNNNKLNNDLKKLADRPERHRYVFFLSPMFRGNQRLMRFERDGIQVWSVDV